MTHEEMMEFLKGRGPRPEPVEWDPWEAKRRVRGDMNVRSGLPYNQPSSIKKPSP